MRRNGPGGWIYLLFLVLGGGLSSVSGEEIDTTRPGAESGATVVKMRIIWLDLDDISSADQNFTANIAFQGIWQDDRLKHEGPGDRTYSLAEIWHPRIQILNRQRLQETFEDEARVSPDGEVELVQRVWGQFSQPLELHDFPFDSQVLNVDLVTTGHQADEIVFESSVLPSETSDSFSVADWSVAGFEVGPIEVPMVRGTPPVDLFRFSLTMKRKSGYHIVNVILPLVLIICMSWIVFWIPPSNLGPRVSVSVTSMLTLVAYRFAIGASLPRIGYLTRLDWFILGSSLLIFISLVQVVITSWMAENDLLPRSRPINRFMRYAAPVTLVLIAYFSFS